MNDYDDLVQLEDINQDDRYCDKSRKEIRENYYEKMKQCKKQCPPGCTDHQISFDHSMHKNEFEIIYIRLAHSRDKLDQIIEHIPKWNFQDLFASIGGLAGLWLGWSLEHIVELMFTKIFNFII